MPIAEDVVVGTGVRIIHHELVNLFGCEIGSGSMVGPFVEIQRGVRIGQLCKIESHSFICSGVQIGDDVFVGHGVMFTNDRWPRATNSAGLASGTGDWELEPTFVEDRVSIGSGAVILPGVRLGEASMIGAGAVVTKDVPPFAVVAGCPARVLRYVGIELDAEDGTRT